MKIVKKIGKKNILIIAVILLALIGFILINMKPSVYYRTYTKEAGWSKWSKNGETSGTDNNTLAIQVKIKSKTQGDILFKSYINDSWEPEDKNSNGVSGNKKDIIKEFRLKLSGKLNEKYNVKYRVLKNDGNWSFWSANYSPAFYWDVPNKNNKVLPIKKIQIKIEKK